MENVFEKLTPNPTGLTAPFTPISRYYPTMDYLIYLKEDCSYRADRVDEALTLLWHPYSDNLVGIKIKGFRCLCAESQTLAKLASDESGFLSLAAVVARILLRGAAEAIMAAVELDRKNELRRKYALAIEFTAPPEVKVSYEELRRAA